LFRKAEWAVLAFLAQTWTMCGALAASLVLMGAFVLARPSTGGTLLDSLITGRAAARRLDAMSLSQKRNHVLITAGLDTLYPLAYGAFLAGVALRFGGGAPLLAIPAGAAMIADYCENVVQLLALCGVRGPLPLKTVLTPLKFALVAAAALLAVALFVLSFTQR
jgi:hypothetical protein